MLTREKSEEREYRELAECAAKSAETLGRQRAEEKCDFRTDFQRDRDRIIHSKALRRLMHKTQVFIARDEDHFRTRLTHTLEVAQISRTIARALRLNEDLTEAIAMGHDLGHTPFGHAGERELARVYPGGFAHNVQSRRVCDVLESNAERRGMNLTEEVRDGILNHTGDGLPFTLEGRIVRIADRMAYVNHDADDAIRSGIIMEDELPKSVTDVLGTTTGRRINTLTRDMALASDGTGDIRQSETCMRAMNELRAFLFERVYYSERVAKEGERFEIEKVVPALYEYYLHNPDRLPGEYLWLADEYGPAEAAKDHVASMTDRYAGEVYRTISNPCCTEQGL